MANVDASVLKFHTVPEDSPVSFLEIEAAFNKLTDKEKRYAHHMSRASWLGSLIVLEQISPESPDIFRLLQRVFSAQSVAELTQQCKANGLEDVDVKHFLEYATAFYGNMGNYLSFGDTKFVPRLSKEKFVQVVTSANLGPNKDNTVALCNSVVDKVYSLQPNERMLGYPDTNTSTYYSSNVTRDEIALCNDALVAAKISPYNTRLLKDEQGQLTLHIASAESKVGDKIGPNGEIQVVYGDYDGKLGPVADELEQAIPFAANETQKHMLEAYVKSFRGGSIDDHKESQRHWVKDIAPVVETNLGFIESYRDPSGVRGEWEGLVAAVNKETSKKFGALVDNAKTFLPLLPWGDKFEKDEFKKPDFTSLEVITFAGSGIPAGINIPNYDDIRQNFGFKNVSLGNVLSAKSGSSVITFLREDDQKLFEEFKGPSFEVQVGCHELLGHGSGKLFMETKTADGGSTLNFDKSLVNPLTKKPIESWYKPGQTYDTQFASVGSSYEECRAECVGIFLSTNTDLLKIFSYEGAQAETIMYVNWLNMVRAGVCALEFYSPEKKQWRQAHMQARFAILQTLLNAGEDFVKLTYGDNEDGDALIELDRSKIRSVGVPAIAKFLTELQVYKATADVARGVEMYVGISSVPDDYLTLRKIVINKKQPRKVFVQAHTELDGNSVKLHTFEPSAAGMVQSFQARFPQH